MYIILRIENMGSIYRVIIISVQWLDNFRYHPFVFLPIFSIKEGGGGEGNLV